MEEATKLLTMQGEGSWDPRECLAEKMGEEEREGGHVPIGFMPKGSEMGKGKKI